jgi:hypothetical protein
VVTTFLVFVLRSGRVALSAGLRWDGYQSESCPLAPEPSLLGKPVSSRLDHPLGLFMVTTAVACIRPCAPNERGVLSD